MNNTYFGYQLHKQNTRFNSNDILFSKEEESITVSKALDSLDYVLTFISSRFDTSVNKYRTALTVFNATKFILENKPRAVIPKVTKSMAKICIDVIEEIANSISKDDFEVQENAQKALICKILIDGVGFFGGI